MSPGHSQNEPVTGAAPPAPAQLFDDEQLVGDDRLGNSGLVARGPPTSAANNSAIANAAANASARVAAASSPSASPSASSAYPPGSLKAMVVANNGSSSNQRGRTAGGAPGGQGPSAFERYGSNSEASKGMALLAPSMAALDRQLLGVLQTQAARNAAVMQAVKGAADTVLAAPVGTTPIATAAQRRATGEPGSAPVVAALAPTSVAARVHGALPAAAASPSIVPPAFDQQALTGGNAQDHVAQEATPSLEGALTRGPASSSPATWLPRGRGSAAQSRLVLGPRWGVSEGGRDSLGWVRSLVKYTESNPLYISDERSPEASVDPSGTGFRKTVFPSLRPDRREDAALLGRWLQDMVGRLSTHDAAALAAQVAAGVGAPPASDPATGQPSSLPPQLEAAAGSSAGNESGQQQQQQGAGSPSAGGAGGLGGSPATVLELADGVLHVYGVAFEELKRQVSTECKERGELLGLLLEHWTGAVQLREGLAAEARLGAMQAEYARLMAARDQLTDSITSLEAALDGADQEARAAAVAAAAAQRSLAAQLAGAQAQAEELAGRWRVSDLALNNEVERRLATEHDLAHTKALLSQQEHEWLAYRAKVGQLEEENAALLAQLQASHRELEARAAAADAAHRQFEDLAAARAAQDVELSRMRHEYETDEILIVSLKQQVRDLEGQLAQLKAFQRDQALKLGSVAADKEELEITNAGLTADLGSSTNRVAELESTLAATDTQLKTTQVALAAKEEEYDKLAARYEHEVDNARDEINGLKTEVRQLSDKLDDTQYRLSTTATKLKEAEAELSSLREMLNSVCRTMDNQGAEAVPKADDKGWNVPGPLGAAQRSIMLINKQLGSLWERLEALRRESNVMSERLEGEVLLGQKLTGELYASRAAEAKTLREKEEAQMALDFSNQAKRVLEAEQLGLRADLAQAVAQATERGAEVEKLRKEAEELRPHKAMVKDLTARVEDLEEQLRVTRDALMAAKEDIKQLTAQQEFFKAEVERLLTANSALVDQVKELQVVQAEADELRGSSKNLADEVEDLQRKLEAALAAHEDTLHQLEIARFFLQGMDLVAPRSPASSTHSATMRPGTGGSTPPHASWRPATAPAGRRPDSARPGSARPRTAGGTEGVEYLPVGALDLVPEESEASPSPAMRIPRGGSHGTFLSTVASLGAPNARDLLSGSGSLNAFRGEGGSSSGLVHNNATAMMAAALGSLRSRPTSAVSQVSGASSLYGEETPPEIAAMLDARGVNTRLQNTNIKWLKFKAYLLSYFCNRLRAQLLKEREKTAALEVQLARQQVEALEDAIAREVSVSEELLGNLRGQLERAKHDTVSEVRQIKAQLPDIKADMEALAVSSTAMGVGLRELQARLLARTDGSSQTGEALDARWAAFIQSLPQEPPLQPLTRYALNEVIVRIYMRVLPSVESTPVWGAQRHDTVYDAIMGHYTSQRAPGAYMTEYLQDVEGPIGRLLRCTRLSVGNTRAATFAYFTGVHPDGTQWPPATWHFFLHLLHGLQLLLAGTWRTTVRAWTSPQGALIPIQAVYDLVGNLYNVQIPTDLEGPIAKRLAAIVVPGQAGPVVDLDALLLMLISEYNSGQCPRAALLFPRRLTDGALFNIFNTSGFSPHLEALADGRVAVILTHAGHSSPHTSPLRLRAKGEPPSAGVSPREEGPDGSHGGGAATAQLPPLGSNVVVVGSTLHTSPRTPSRPGSALVPTSSGRLSQSVFNPSASVSSPPTTALRGKGLQTPGAGIPVPGLQAGVAVQHHLGTVTTGPPVLGANGVVLGTGQFTHHMHHLGQGLTGPMELAAEGGLRFVRPATSAGRSK